MLDLLELEQLAAFAEYGTLSKAAQELHISQPTLTRTMKRLEEEFGVPLFVRGKNKIELNETGAEAAACCSVCLHWRSIRCSRFERIMRGFTPLQ